VTLVVAALGTVLAVSGSFAAGGPKQDVANRGVAPDLARHFAIFANWRKKAIGAHAADADAIALAVAPGHPALQQALETMMQSNDPTQQYELDFAAAVLSPTQDGQSALAVPGAQGACVVMELPTTSLSTFGAGSECNTNANIVANGGLRGTFTNYRLGVSVTYGMAPNATTTADVTSANNSFSRVPVHNAFAFESGRVRQVVLRTRDGHVVRRFDIARMSARLRRLR
jgi:hypothetical protein